MKIALVVATDPQLRKFFDEVASAGGATFNWTGSSLADEIGKSQTWGLWRDATLCAIACFRGHPEALELTACLTLASERRRGCMFSLLKEAIPKVLSGSGVQKVWLEVHESNTAALKVYRKLGFLSVGSRAHYYKDGGTAILLEYVA